MTRIFKDPVTRRVKRITGRLYKQNTEKCCCACTPNLLRSGGGGTKEVKTLTAACEEFVFGNGGCDFGLIDAQSPLPPVGFDVCELDVQPGTSPFAGRVNGNGICANCCQVDLYYYIARAKTCSAHECGIKLWMDPTQSDCVLNGLNTKTWLDPIAGCACAIQTCDDCALYFGPFQLDYDPDGLQCKCCPIGFETDFYLGIVCATAPAARPTLDCETCAPV